MCSAVICTGGVTCHDFWYGRAAWVPGPHPIHKLGEVKKKQTHSYTYHIENCTHSYAIFQILPIHILFGWKRYPIDILLMWKWYSFIYLEAWKVYPFQSHVSVYRYNGSPPSPRGYLLPSLSNVYGGLPTWVLSGPLRATNVLYWLR